MRYNNITGLNLQGCINLENLYCNNNPIAQLDFSDQGNLKLLNCNSNNLTELDIHNLVNLENIDIGHTHLETLDLSACVNLKVFTSIGADLQQLNFQGLTELQEIRCGYTNTLIGVMMGYHPDLTNFDCALSNIEQIDLSGCPVLETFNCASADQLRYVNLKNGPQITSIDGYSNTLEKFLCIDEGEEQFLPLYIQTSTHISSYCTFTPGGGYNTITGTLTFDADTNGCDAADSVMPLAKININDGTDSGATFSSLAGNYSFYTQAGTFVLMPQFYGNDWFTAAPQTVSFAAVDDGTVTQNFCVTANGVHPDLAVIIVPVVRARPGFDAVYKIIYGNKGNQLLSGSAILTYNDDVLEYVSALPVENSSSTGSLVWDFTNLRPFEYRTATVTFNANSPTESPAVNIGDVLPFTAIITPTAGDETPLDNTFAFNQVVIGSLDPNEISCLEGANVDPAHIGDYLHYNINFENTGTAPATFIAVKDIIDSTKFDVSSLQVLDASHPVQTRVTGNKAEFYFADINLGGGEKGNVTFKIKSLSTLAANSTVTQQADIYFDYNAPVATNEANTTYALLSTGSFVKDASVALYPNPAKTVVTIKASSEIRSIQLYDIQGRLLQAGSGNTLDVSSRATGLYFVKVTTAKGTSVEKLVKE